MPPGHPLLSVISLLNVAKDSIVYCLFSQMAYLVPGEPLCSLVSTEHVDPASQTSCETLGKQYIHVGVLVLYIHSSPGTASLPCHFCLLVTPITLLLFLPHLTFSCVPCVNAIGQKSGILLIYISIVLICLLRDAFSFILTAWRDFEMIFSLNPLWHPFSLPQS